MDGVRLDPSNRMASLGAVGDPRRRHRPLGRRYGYAADHVRRQAL